MSCPSRWEASRELKVRGVKRGASKRKKNHVSFLAWISAIDERFARLEEHLTHVEEHFKQKFAEHERRLDELKGALLRLPDAFSSPSRLKEIDELLKRRRDALTGRSLFLQGNRA